MSTIKTETLSTPSNSTVPVDTVVNGTAKAWVNFNGTGTVAIRRSFNVSSITDNGTGLYTVNFTTAMPDANYSAVGSTIGSADVSYATYLNGRGIALSVSSVHIESRNSVNDAQLDSSCVNVAIFS